MFCSKCGQEIPYQSAFCNLCGARIAQSAYAASGKLGFETKVIIAVAALTICLLGVTLLLINGRDSSTQRPVQAKGSETPQPLASQTPSLTPKRKASPIPTPAPALVEVQAPALVPTPMPTPLLARSILPLERGTFVLAPGQYRYKQFVVDERWRSSKLFGKFSAAGGSGNDVKVYVLSGDDFENWAGGHAYHQFYESGKVTVGSIDLMLAPGVYCLVFSNKFSVFANKAITADVGLAFEYLRQP